MVKRKACLLKKTLHRRISQPSRWSRTTWSLSKQTSARSATLRWALRCSCTSSCSSQDSSTRTLSKHFCMSTRKHAKSTLKRWKISRQTCKPSSCRKFKWAKMSASDSTRRSSRSSWKSKRRSSSCETTTAWTRSKLLVWLPSSDSYRKITLALQPTIHEALRRKMCSDTSVRWTTKLNTNLRISCTMCWRRPLDGLMSTFMRTRKLSMTSRSISAIWVLVKTTTKRRVLMKKMSEFRQR